MRQYTIVQSRILTPEILQGLSFFRPRRLNEQAALIEHEDAALTKAIEALKLDLAYVPSSQNLEHIGLVAMDMDSTLITIECIDEIADFCGLKAEVLPLSPKEAWLVKLTLRKVYRSALLF